MTCAYCGVFELSQEILYMWPGDSEEVSKPGSIVSIKVVRDLLEKVGESDRHDRPVHVTSPAASSLRHPNGISIIKHAMGDSIFSFTLISYNGLATNSPSVRLGQPSCPSHLGHLP